MGLRKIRLQRGYTQVELGKLANLDQTQISALERADDPNPEWKTVRRLSRALKVKPEELFRLGGPR